MPLNSGLAEEVYLMAPDLVLAGLFTREDSLRMLERLGVPVERFGLVRSLDDLAAALRRMGRLLGREARAEAVIAGFEGAMAEARAEAAALPRLEAAYYYQNSYTSGRGTLAAALMAEAGLDNLAARLGLQGAASLPLELLVTERPFLIRSASITISTVGRSGEGLKHPALEAMAERAGEARVRQRWQVCGTPFVVETVRALTAARR